MTISTTELNGPPAGTLAIRPGQDMWTDKQRAALAVLGITNATNADLAVFMHYCQKTGLDPFSRQIYMICRREKRNGEWVEKQTIQVGIDGFRVIRDRIAQRLRIDVEYEDTIWYDDTGAEHGVWLSDTPPAACKVVVRKNGHRFPAVLRTAAYAAVNRDGDAMAQWKTQPDHMIEKCAEAFALRRAFPHDLGGIYLDDEIPPPPATPSPSSTRLTAADITPSSAAQVTGVPPAAADVPGPDEPHPPAAAAGSAPVAAAPGPGTHTQPVMKSQLGKLRKLPLGQEADLVEAASLLIGRPLPLLETLTRDEADQILAAWEDALQYAQGDTEAAAASIENLVPDRLNAREVPDDGV